MVYFGLFIYHDALYSFNTETRSFQRRIDLSDIEPIYATVATDGTLYFSAKQSNSATPGWASLEHEAIYQFSPETNELIQITIPGEWPIYRGLLSDSKGQLWLGSIGFRDEDGVWNLLHTNPDFFFRDPMMGGWMIPTLSLQSSDGRLWYSNWWDGGIWWKGSAWYDPETSEGCMFTNVPSNIIEDTDRQLWLVANGNLYKYALNP